METGAHFNQSENSEMADSSSFKSIFAPEDPSAYGGAKCSPRMLLNTLALLYKDKGFLVGYSPQMPSSK
jgi:hypothetical protein